MNFSAAASSSEVVTPGRHFAASILRQRAWMRPAAAIASSCSSVFRMMPPRYIRSGFFLHTQGSEQSPDVLVDFVWVLFAVDPLEDAPLLVPGDQRLGLLAVLVD